MLKKLLFALSYLYFVVDLFLSIPSNYGNLKVLAALCFIFPLPYFLEFIKKDSKLIKVWKNLSTSVYSAFLLIFVFNMVVLMAPALAKKMPATIVNYYQLENLKDVREETVEYIEESPFVKFKPNVVARSQGYRGDTSQFKYTWKTDDWGFKNEPGRTGKRCDALFIGNSFTEGMGVSVDETLPSRYEKLSGNRAYNLGVQGYAPTQMKGTYDLYGSKLNPKRVFMVYYSTIFERELKFLDIEKAKAEKDFTGGIGNISKKENLRETKAGSQSRRIFTSVLIAGYNYVRRGNDHRKEKMSEVNNAENRSFNFSKYAVLSRYQEEIEQSINGYDHLIEEIVSNGVAWSQTKNVIKDLQTECHSHDHELVLVYVPRRACVYYRVVTDDSTTTFIDDYERSAFAEFCDSEKIQFVDPTDEIIEYTKKQSSIKDNVERLPYLEIDRHMSKYGYGVIANVIFENYK